METVLLILFLGIASYFGFDLATEPIDTGDPVTEQLEVTTTGETTIVSGTVVKKVEEGWQSGVAGAVFRDWKCVPENKNYDATIDCFKLQEVGWQEPAL